MIELAGYRIRVCGVRCNICNESKHGVMVHTNGGAHGDGVEWHLCERHLEEVHDLLTLVKGKSLNGEDVTIQLDNYG